MAMATPCSNLHLSSNSDGTTFNSINVASTHSTASYTVYVRIKPLDVHQPSNSLCEEHFSATDSSITTVDSSKKHEMHQNTFKFAQVFLPMASQVEIFDAAIEPRLREFFDGTDALIFSYGTSSSGKSHTVQGTPKDPGLIPRALKTMYGSVSGLMDKEYRLVPYKSIQAVMLSKSDMAHLEKEKSRIFNSLTPSNLESADVTISEMAAADMLTSLGDTPTLPTCVKDDEVCSLWVSFFEVYNEHVFDLLTFRQEQKLQPLGIKMDPDDQSYYPSGLKHLPAASWEEAYDIYRFGKKNLHVASTLLNRKSSRSHCVFTVKMLIRPKADESSYYPPVSFSICDLAGSERMMAHCETKTGSSFKEMRNINNSLLTLNKCFLTLKRGNNTVLPPFRDSQFTKLIKKFLTGQGKLVMIATISQSPELLPQTQQILKMTSIAHTTRVIIKEPTVASHALLKNTPKRRFSTNYQSGMPDGRRPHLEQIAEDALPHQDVENLTQQVLQLQLEKENLLMENRGLRDQTNKALDDLAHQRGEYESLKESHEHQAQIIKQLEEKFGMVESGERVWYNKTMELIQELSDTNRKNFEEKINLQTDLCLARRNLNNIVNPLKEQFSIDSNNPHQIAQRVIFLFKDVKTAAAEEIAEFGEELSKCQAELAKSVEKVANLTAQVNQLEEELSIYRQPDLPTTKTSPVDDTLSDMDENEYRSVRTSRKLRYTTGRLEDEEPLVPIREIKTSTKKRRTRKATLKSKDATLQPAGLPEGGSLRRNPRRLLLGDNDCLPDDFVSDVRVSPSVQLSPGSAMKSLRSTSRRK